MEPSSKLSSWSQAFEDHSIVQTRVIEKQLRADIAHNKQKLRNLVGGSYRDLLSTAEQIITLDSKTRNVEANISEINRHCRPKQYVSPQVRPQHNNVAQLSLLHRCSACIASCLKTGHLILTAKLLAMSRLLHTSLGKQDHPPKVLDTLLDQLSRSRRRLLRRIDRRLDDARVEQSELTAIISAFCLATSSSCSDAIHHFQRRRIGQIHHSSQGAHGDHQHTAKTFKYYIDSLRTTKLLLGPDVPRALQKLQQTAILHDPEVIRLEHLNINTLRMLMPDEIQNFAPYVKKSTLSDQDAKNLLKKWSEEAFKTVQTQLTAHLETLGGTSSAFRLRQDLMAAWLQFCFSTSAHANIVDALRTILNEHIETLIQVQVSDIANIATRIVESSESALADVPANDFDTDTTTPAIWFPRLVTQPLTRPANSFLTQLRTAHLGGNPSLLSLSTSLTTWCSAITTLRTQIASLSHTRWQDHLEEPEDTDEETAKSILRNLSITDPASYSEILSSNLTSSLNSLHARLGSASTACNSVSESLFLLRAIRELTTQLSASFPEISLEKLHSAVPHLHSVLASHIVTQLSTRMETQTSRKVSPLSSLPSDLPSPAAFRTLHTLCSIMLKVGGIDTWTSAATSVTKAAILSHILQTETRRHYLRNEFDEVYLRTALGGDLVDMTAEPIESGVQKAAIEYCGRTRLLFGVLNP